MGNLSIFNIGIIIALLTLGISLLPVSPFNAFISAVGDIPYLSWLNWFFPVSELIAVLEAWLVAILIFYVASAILHWAGAIR